MKKLTLALVLAAGLHAIGAGAVGTLIPSENRVDMVHDTARNTIYITEGGNVLRYHVPSATFLTPIVLGGNLKGIDLSPDGATLAVADKSSGSADQWVHLVNLSDLTVSKASITKEYMEDGMWAVAYAADGTLFATASHSGSGLVPMRRFDPANNSWSKLGAAYPDNSFSQNAMVSASGDGKVVAFAESNISTGDWGSIEAATGQLTRRAGYANGTSAYNFEIAANSNASQFAIPTYRGTFIYDRNYAKIGTIGQYAGVQPIGVAYHPVESLVYFPMAGTGEVHVYDSATLTGVGSYDFEDSFQTTGNWAFRQGRTRLSKDGSLLMVSVTGGVRVVLQYAPLAADPVSGSVNSGSPLTLGLKGSIGNGGALSYKLASAPAHGTATLSGSNVTYTPAAGYSGADSFNYTVSYGGASVQSSVSVSVIQPNRAPVAVADSATTRKNMAVSIPVLANDSDPDRDTLAITSVTVPTSGKVRIQDGTVVYTPAFNFRGNASFSYAVSDGKGGSATAAVTVTVTK